MPRRRSLAIDSPLPPDGLRCARSDGRRWRCALPASPGLPYCDHHAVRRRVASSKLEPSKQPERVDADHPESPPDSDEQPDPPAVDSDEQPEPAMDENDQNGPASFSDPTPNRRRRKSRAGDSRRHPLATNRRRRRRLPGDPTGVITDKLRCRRSDGRKWRCSKEVLPGLSFCEYHRHKAKANEDKLKGLANAASVSCGPEKKRAHRGSCSLEDDDLLVAELQKLVTTRNVKKKTEGLAAPIDDPPQVDGAVHKHKNGMQLSFGSDSSYREEGEALLDSEECEKVQPLQRKFRSKNAELVPIGIVKRLPAHLGGRKPVEMTCHRCRKKMRTRIVSCSSCCKEAFCYDCIRKWYGGLPKRDVKMLCPVCRRCCSCLTCSQEDAIYQSKRFNVKSSDCSLADLLPLLRINKEEIDELEMEAQMQGTKISSLCVQLIEASSTELLDCDNCKHLVSQFMRWCPECSYKICLRCCQRIREGNMGDVLCVGTSLSSEKAANGKGYTLSDLKQKTAETLESEVGDISSLHQELPKGMCGLLNGNTTCPSKAFGSCGSCPLNLAYVCPNDCSEEHCLGTQRATLPNSNCERVALSQRSNEADANEDGVYADRQQAYAT